MTRTKSQKIFNAEQPAEMRILEEISETLSQMNPDELNEAVQAICQAKRVFVTGAGRSLLMMRAFAMRLMHIGLTAYVVGDTTTPAITENDLLMVGSGSGETSSLILQVEKGRKINAQVLLLTIFPKSTLAQSAQLTVQIPGATYKNQSSPNRTVQLGGSLFEQSLLIILDSLVIRLCQQLAIDYSLLSHRHANLE